MDVGENSSAGNGDSSEKLVELLVVADSKLKVSGHDTGLLVVTSSVSSELQDLSSEVLEDSSKVHGGTSSNTLGDASVLDVTGDTSNGELKTSLGTARGSLLLVTTTSTFSFSFSRHY